jgi:hypothetical protein
MQCAPYSGNIRKPLWSEILAARSGPSQLVASSLVLGFVVTSFAAGGTVVESVVAQSDVQLALTESAILLARATRFAHFAKRADILFAGSSG